MGSKKNILTGYLAYLNSIHQLSGEFIRVAAEGYLKEKEITKIICPDETNTFLGGQIELISSEPITKLSPGCEKKISLFMENEDADG